MLRLTLLNFFTGVLAQQIYVSVGGPVATPVYRFSEFAFTEVQTVRTATSVTPGPTTTYAPPYESLSHLVPNLSTTTWGNWDPNATVPATDTADPFGQAAWSSMWERVSIVNFTRGLYSTTVSPTPVPTSELIFPPPDPMKPESPYNFPEGFIFGLAGSASQIEGAIADEGRSPTILELFANDANGLSTDYVANENYYLYKQDIERLAAMGVTHYSFSIPWTRILPFVLEGTPVNQAGLAHYDDLIDFVIEKGMQPVVTLIHFDLPSVFISNMTGTTASSDWLNNGSWDNETFVDAFVNYGKIVMTHFADRVPLWITINEPATYCHNGKSVDAVIKSHARLYHFYHDVINGTGLVSIKIPSELGVPLNPLDEADLNATKTFNEFYVDTFSNAIFLGEDYPESFKNLFPDYVPLTQEDLEYINGTADIFANDFYTPTIVSPLSYGLEDCLGNISNSFFPTCVNMTSSTTTGWDIGYGSNRDIFISPTYLRINLNYLWNKFRKPVLLAEFGFPVFAEADKDLADQLYDTPRSMYYLSALSEILNAIWEDNIHIYGVFAWSFADNWEFGSYEQHFGIQTVNRTTQERRYKKSFFDLIDFVTDKASPNTN